VRSAGEATRRYIAPSVPYSHVHVVGSGRRLDEDFDECLGAIGVQLRSPYSHRFRTIVQICVCARQVTSWRPRHTGSTPTSSGPAGSHPLPCSPADLRKHEMTTRRIPRHPTTSTTRVSTTCPRTPATQGLIGHRRRGHKPDGNSCTMVQQSSNDGRGESAHSRLPSTTAS
jgi:hypothetical protein